jgi:hypothetical protein
MPIQNIVLVSAFGNRTRRIKKQAMVEVTIHEYVFDHVFLVSAQIVTPLILGMDYLLSGNAVMSFKETVAKRDFSQRGSGNILYNYANVRQRERKNDLNFI